jgi:hypothetical protein
VGAPDLPLAGKIDLSADRAVHLGMVAHNDARLFRKIFCTHNSHFGVKKPYKKPDDPVTSIRKTLFLFQVTPPPVGNFFYYSTYFSFVYEIILNSANCLAFTNARW